MNLFRVVGFEWKRKWGEGLARLNEFELITLCC